MCVCVHVCVCFCECRPGRGLVALSHGVPLRLGERGGGGGVDTKREKEGERDSRAERKRNDLDNSLGFWHARTHTLSLPHTRCYQKHIIIGESWPQESPGKHSEIGSYIFLPPQGRIHELNLSIKGNSSLLPQGYKQEEYFILELRLMITLAIYQSLDYFFRLIEQLFSL